MNDWGDICSKFPLSEENRKLLPHFLNYIQAPPNLKAFLGVAEVFLSLINDQGFDDFPKDAYEFKDLVKQIYLNRTKVKEVIPISAACRVKEAKTVIHGIINDYPMYSLLYYIYVNPENPLSLLRLQQALISGVYNPHKDAKRLKPTDISNYGLAIRQITDVDQGRAWLANMDTHAVNSLSAVRKLLAQFSDDIENPEIKIETDDEDELIKINTLKKSVKNSHLFLDAVNGFHVIRRTVSKKRITEFRKSLGVRGISDLDYSEYCEVRVLGDDDDPSEYPEIHAVVIVSDNKEINQEAEELGLEPNEIQEPFEFIFVRYQNIPAYAQAFNDAVRARGAIKRMEIQNQYLPMSTQLLNDYDLDQLSKLISKLSIGEEKELGLLLSGIFATSTSVDDFINLQVIHKKEEFISGELSIGYDLEKKSWLIPVYSLDLKTDFDDTSECSRNTETDYFSIPDMFGFSRRLNKLFIKDIPSKPFKELKQAKNKIKSILRESNDRLTLSRVERYLSLRVAGKHEPTQATYLFNRYLSSSSARRFYTAQPTSHYQDIYSNVCEDVLNKINSDFKIQKKAAGLSDCYIGARYCPKTSHIKDVLKKMQRDISQYKKDLIENGDWRTFHNLYTTYVIYAQGLLTGIRAVEDPIIGPADIIRELNIAVFRDKDTEDQFHTRTVPLHPIVLNLIDFYEEHRNAILVRLSAINPLDSRKMQSSEAAPFVFLIDENYRCLNVKPSLLKPILSNYTNLPLNSNRKFLRNLLLEENVSMHAIDTLLGHAASGEPFWNSCATIDFTTISEELINKLDVLVSKVELNPQQGLFV